MSCKSWCWPLVRRLCSWTRDVCLPITQSGIWVKTIKRLVTLVFAPAPLWSSLWFKCRVWGSVRARGNFVLTCSHMRTQQLFNLLRSSWNVTPTGNRNQDMSQHWGKDKKERERMYLIPKLKINSGQKTTEFEGLVEPNLRPHNGLLNSDQPPKPPAKQWECT